MGPFWKGNVPGSGPALSPINMRQDFLRLPRTATELNFFVICQKSGCFELSFTSGITRSEPEAGMDSRTSSVHLQIPRTARYQDFSDLRRYASPGPGTANRSRPFKRRSGREIAQSLVSNFLSLVVTRRFRTR